MTIAITLGDPAGIGPELIVASWSEIYRYNPIVFGHPTILRNAIKLRNVDLNIVEIDNINQTRSERFVATANRIPCLKVVDDDAANVPYGKVDSKAGKAAYDSIVHAVDSALARQVDAIVTPPIQKESLNLAGYHYPGHTELLAEKCGVSDFAMMLYLGPGENLSGKEGLAVVHVTLHAAMKTIFEQITVDSVLQKSKLIDAFMGKIKGTKPEIGVCSLNPHAGEGGLFGDEEIRTIRPAIELAKAAGLHISGPYPADTIMVQAKNGRFDAVVAMFHDQGHIALKLLGMYRAVNITLGLPIIRTSVAHGTAFDIAGKGIAQTGSMIEAVRVAHRLL